jgi:hypothetical protein
VTVHLAWTDQVVDDAIAGPSSELRTAAPGVLFIELKGLAPGSLAWLRARRNDL